MLFHALSCCVVSCLLFAFMKYAHMERSDSGIELNSRNAWFWDRTEFPKCMSTCMKCAHVKISIIRGKCSMHGNVRRLAFWSSTGKCSMHGRWGKRLSLPTQNFLHICRERLSTAYLMPLLAGKHTRPSGGGTLFLRKNYLEPSWRAIPGKWVTWNTSCWVYCL